MKIPPGLRDPDVCQASIEVLKSRCENLFRSYPEVRNLWIADFQDPPPTVPHGEVLDVVFFGKFLTRILETGNWPSGRYRFWALSKSVIEVLVRLVGVPRKSIGRIPRYALFDHTPAAQMPGGKTPFTWVFAGRLSATKNIGMLLKTASFLQTQENVPVRLELIGEADDEYHLDFGRRELPRYEPTLRALTDSLKWSRPPQFHSKVEPWEWLQRPFENPVLVNFSTFASEDFDVSLAQAQSAGWPALVTDWGGHREATGVMKVHPAEIGASHEPDVIVSWKARLLARKIARNLQEPITWVTQETSLQFPDSLSSSEIDELRHSWIKRVGPDLHSLYRQGMGHFADTPKGAQFFSHYRNLFSGSYPGRPIIVLINDLHPSEESGMQGISQVTQDLLDEALESHSDVVFVGLRELEVGRALPDFMLDAKEIVLPLDVPRVTKALRTWLPLFGHGTKLRIFSGPERGWSQLEAHA